MIAAILRPAAPVVPAPQNTPAAEPAPAPDIPREPSESTTIAIDTSDLPGAPALSATDSTTRRPIASAPLEELVLTPSKLRLTSLQLTGHAISHWLMNGIFVAFLFAKVR